MPVAAPSVQVLKWKPRGPVMFANRDVTVTPARPSAFDAVDCVDTLALALNVAYLTHTSKCSALDVEDKRDVKSLTGELTIAFSNYTPDNVMAGISGSKVAAEGSPVAVTGEQLPTVAGGQFVLLGGSSPNHNITALTITDSSSALVSLAANTDYVLDPEYGMVTFKADLSAYTQPFVAAYSHANMAKYAALTQTAVERWIRFNGFNAVNGNKAVPVDMFRVQFAPAQALDFLPDDYGKLEIKAAVLIDLTRQTTDPLGQFLSIGMAS